MPRAPASAVILVIVAALVCVVHGGAGQSRPPGRRGDDPRWPSSSPPDVTHDTRDEELARALFDFVAVAEHDRHADDTFYLIGYRAVVPVVRQLFGWQRTVTIAGSVAVGLHLRAPISDLDLVVRHPTMDASEGLRRLSDSMRGNPAFSSVTFFPVASTPIVKATLADSSLTIDIVWNVANVDESLSLVRDALTTFPLFKPIVLYMKHYLYVHDLGHPYRGGLGSFPLYLLVIFHLQVNAALCAVSAGACLRAFFGYYGSAFPADDYCVSVQTNGYLVPRAGRPAQQERRPLCIVSPFDARVDVGRSAFNFGDVRRQLYATYLSMASI
ncbi:PAP-associated domain-containing protein [Plasmodiophora brassicae]